MGCLVAIFLVTLLFNLGVVRRAKVIDLMSANRKNEAIKTRNPILSAVIFILGAIMIGIAYYRLLRDGLPVDAAPSEYGNALTQFMTTTGIVVVGTILFFFGFSGFLLKVLQSARGLYWRGLNMFTMRQLSAKVNTVSFSMAIISMILFLAITSVTGGMSIANVMNTSVERCTIADYSRAIMYYGPELCNDPEWAAERAQEGIPWQSSRRNPSIFLRRARLTPSTRKGRALAPLTLQASSISACRSISMIPALWGLSSPL